MDEANPQFRFYVDTDPPVEIDLTALMKTSWPQRLPIDVARIRDMKVDERLVLNRIAPTSRLSASRRYGPEAPHSP